MHCPFYQGLYGVSAKKTKGFFDRDCGSMLHMVHFDQNWQPISKEDKEATNGI